MRIFITVLFAFILFLPGRGQAEAVMKKGNPGITFSFPWLNSYRYIDYHKNIPAKKFGFFGVGFSLYYKLDKQKVSFNVSTSEDLSSPAALISYPKSGISTSISSSFFELIYHRQVIGDFHAIAGVNFTNYAFRVSSKVDSVTSYKKAIQTLGLSAGIEYRFNERYSVAGVYRPAIASFETDNHYRHVFNVELRIDLNLKKRAE